MSFSLLSVPYSPSVVPSFAGVRAGLCREVGVALSAVEYGQVQVVAYGKYACEDDTGTTGESAGDG